MKIIKIKDFILRPLKIGDAEAYFEVMKDLETKKNLTDYPKSLKETKKEIIKMLQEVRNKGSEIFTIEIKKEYAGNVFLQYQNWDQSLREGRVHLLIHPNFRGIGLGTKALNEVINYGFRKKFDKIYAQCKATNKGIIKIIKKLGFKKIKSYVNEEGVRKILWAKLK